MRATTAATVVVLMLLQLLAVALLGHRQGWPGLSTGSEVGSGILVVLQLVLLYALASRIGGRIYALCAGLVLVAGPVILAKRYFVIGGPNIDYKSVYREHVLPTGFGLVDRSELAAACLLLAATLFAVIRPSVAATAASAGLTAAAVLVYPHVWIALAAPVLAAVIARRPREIGAALAIAGLALIALAVFRTIPHVSFGWHAMGQTLGGVREYSWSRRVLEYLPLGGVAGVARRSGRAAAFLGTVLLAAVILPLASDHDLTAYLLATIPGQSTYWLLAASLGFLWPRGSRETHGVAAQAQVTIRQ